MNMKKKGGGRIAELDGLRVLMIFIVSWYHLWQQSWLAPEIRIDALNIHWSLDWLVRSGYVWVDGTVLLSAFLLYLPLARGKLRGDPLPETGEFYYRKARRILPGYLCFLLLAFFAMALPWGLYWSAPYMVKDLALHLSFTYNLSYDTYVSTPLGAAPWTLAVIVQGYAVFPLLARGMRKHPAAVLVSMGVLCAGFRAWCLWALTDYTMVVNQLINFLDVYVLGFLGAMLQASLEQREQEWKAGEAEYPNRSFWFRVLRTHAATLGFFGFLAGLVWLLHIQAASQDYAAIQRNQMLLRPAYAVCFLGMALSAPRAVKALRVLLGNPVMKFLAALSMNYYLVHQTLMVHMKYRLRFPGYVSENPAMAGEQPWQSLYTLLVFALSVALAAAITWGVEKPVGKLMDRIREKKKKEEIHPV